jgi:multiple sugar transport system ATP-binding protein
MTLADRIVVMREGKVEQIGAPLDLYDTPINMFVAGFIGSPGMNFLRGILVDDPRVGPALALGNQRIPLHRKMSAPPGRRIVYGIRPEHLLPQPNGEVRLETEVVESTGTNTFLTGNVGGTRITMCSTARLSANPGEVVEVTPIAEKICVFDDETGMAI